MSGVRGLGSPVLFYLLNLCQHASEKWSSDEVSDKNLTNLVRKATDCEKLEARKGFAPSERFAKKKKTKKNVNMKSI